MPTYQCMLSVVDQTMPLINTPMWLVFKAENPDSTFQAIKLGLEKTVTQLPFLSGEVFVDSQDGWKAKIRWTDDDPKVLWEEVAASDSPSYEEFAALGFDLNRFPVNVLPSSYINAVNNNVKPVLIASYIKIPGGLIVLLAPHHGLVDGGGRQLLNQIWAANTQGLKHQSININSREPLDRMQRLSAIIGKATRQDGNHDITHENVSRTAAKGNLHVMRDSGAESVAMKLYQFSARKLDDLRRALRTKTKSDFSLNTMVTALLWVTWVATYVKRSRATDPGFVTEKQESELVMVLNLRGPLVKKSLLEKDSWLGNMPTSISPSPRLAFDDANNDCFEVVLGDSGRALACRNVVPALIDMITDRLANNEISTAVSGWSDLLQCAEDPTFDWRTVRPGLTGVKTNRFVMSNWGSLDLLPDFGPEVGRPTVARSVAPGLLPSGVCATLPRHRDKQCGEDLLDRYDVSFALRTDELEYFEGDELLQALTRD